MARIEDCPGFETFGADIKEARKAKRLTRKDLAEKVNVDTRYLANIENKGTIPSLPVIIQLVKICGLPMERYFNPTVMRQESKLRERVGQKLRLCPEQYALKCKFNGGSVPLGYRINEERHYEPDPVMSPIVREVFERYAGGESIKELCADMNARGIRTGYGRKFVKSSFQNMLRNRRYLGEYRYRDIVTENAFPALIDQETFDKVQARMKANKKAPARSKSDEDFILTGKLVCGNCGALMVGDSGTSHTGATYYYYKCGHRKRKEGERCHMKAFRKELIESFVVKQALGYVLQDRVIAMLADALVENQKRENTHLPALQEELKKVNKKIDNIAAAIEEGIITQTTKERLTALEAQRDELQISIFEEETSHPKLTKEYVVQWLESFKRHDLRDHKVQRQVIECFVNTVYVFEDKIIVNLNLRDGDKPIALSKENGSDIETCGSP